jgi:hypothetical protein
VGCRRFFDTKRIFLGFSIHCKYELIEHTPRGLIASAVSILLKRVHSEMVSRNLFDEEVEKFRELNKEGKYEITQSLTIDDLF